MERNKEAIERFLMSQISMFSAEDPTGVEQLFHDFNLTSLDKLEIVHEVEQTFRVNISDAFFLDKTKTIGDWVSFIEKRLGMQSLDRAFIFEQTIMAIKNVCEMGVLPFKAENICEEADLTIDLGLDSLDIFVLGAELEAVFSKNLPDYYSMDSRKIKDIIDYLEKALGD